ncbi:hypothetical protein [Thermasporomyces composti]|uniref:Uncharacterized protein n=1 Tax=Thermasporomyces composti TaxID=696763 RepID=A0A3D9VDX0_THECX|nr:hypothetical protein [Thermasporomyces composti]REF35521.1 hypothetical protein DFJ64_0902 [Thermasporomyces composti]
MAGNEGRDITYSIAALRKDAKIWSEAAEVLERAKQAAACLCLTVAHFGTVADEACREPRSVTKLYEDVHRKILRLLDEGQRTLDDVGHRLVIIANRLDGTEQKNLEVLRQLGRMLEEKGW